MESNGLRRGIARTRTQTLSNNSFKSFGCWEGAVAYYTQCFINNAIEILEPPIPASNLGPTGGKASGHTSSSAKFLAPPIVPAPPAPSQPGPPPSTTTPHGIGTHSRPITVSPCTPHPTATSKKTENSKTRVKKKDAVIVIPSDDDDESWTIPNPKFANPKVAKPRVPSSAPVTGRRRRVVIIDDDNDNDVVQSDSAYPSPNKRVRRYRMAVHDVVPRPPTEISSEDGSTTVPLPVRLFHISMKSAQAGVVGPLGTISVGAAGPSEMPKPTKPAKQEESEYELDDLEPELLAALCKEL
jgi:hypothetical protein